MTHLFFLVRFLAVKLLGHIQYSCLEKPMDSMKSKKRKNMTLKDEPHRLVGVQYTADEEQRKSYRKNEEAEPSGNNTQLWMCLVVKVKTNAVKSNIA